jgi:hypothetical protein
VRSCTGCIAGSRGGASHGGEMYEEDIERDASAPQQVYPTNGISRSKLPSRGILLKYGFPRSNSSSGRRGALTGHKKTPREFGLSTNSQLPNSAENPIGPATINAVPGASTIVISSTREGPLALQRIFLLIQLRMKKNENYSKLYENV